MFVSFHFHLLGSYIGDVVDTSEPKSQLAEIFDHSFSLKESVGVLSVSTHSRPATKRGKESTSLSEKYAGSFVD